MDEVAALGGAGGYGACGWAGGGGGKLELNPAPEVEPGGGSLGIEPWLIEGLNKSAERHTREMRMRL